MKTLSRILLFVCGLSLIAVLFVPMWRIELDAPQYPEGLMMQIYPNKLGGNVDIINGLNHYIGMKTLHNEDFAEFKILPGIIIFFSVSFLLVALIGKRKWMNWLFTLFVLFGVLAMIDFWRWEYQYGHDLDPDAAIRIPGMAYQPPLIGFKQLLNFGAYSIPDIGGWIFIAVGVCLLGLIIYELKRKPGLQSSSKNTLPLVSVVTIFFLTTACNSKPDAIKLGKDECQFCRMTISDVRFGSVYFTAKGRSLKFDDIICLQGFLKSNQTLKSGKDQIWLVDYMSPNQLVEFGNTFLLKGDNFKSPMNGNIAAFSNENDTKKFVATSMVQKVELNSILQE
jgi:copper chaperone NosL